MAGSLLKPSEGLASKVEPAFADYLADPLSERRANVLASALSHHLVWTYEYYSQGDRSRLASATSLGAFRAALIFQCADLQMMWDLADTTHHRFLTRQSTPKRVVTTSSDAYSLQASELFVSNYGRPFLAAATSAVEFWRRWPD